MKKFLCNFCFGVSVLFVANACDVKCMDTEKAIEMSTVAGTVELPRDWLNIEASKQMNKLTALGIAEAFCSGLDQITLPINSSMWLSARLTCRSFVRQYMWQSHDYWEFLNETYKNVYKNLTCEKINLFDLFDKLEQYASTLVKEEGFRLTSGRRSALAIVKANFDYIIRYNLPVYSAPHVPGFEKTHWLINQEQVLNVNEVIERTRMIIKTSADGRINWLEKFAGSCTMIAVKLYAPECINARKVSIKELVSLIADSSKIACGAIEHAIDHSGELSVYKDDEMVDVWSHDFSNMKAFEIANVILEVSFAKRINNVESLNDERLDALKLFALRHLYVLGGTLIPHFNSNRVSLSVMDFLIVLSTLHIKANDLINEVKETLDNTSMLLKKRKHY